MKPLPFIFIGFLISGLGITTVTAIEKLAHDTYMHAKGW